MDNQLTISNRCHNTTGTPLSNKITATTRGTKTFEEQGRVKTNTQPLPAQVNNRQPRISVHPVLLPIKLNKRSPPPRRPAEWINSNKRLPRWRSFQSILQKPCFVTSSRFFFLAFVVLLQNKNTSLAENGENLISAQPRISTHLE